MANSDKTNTLQGVRPSLLEADERSVTGRLDNYLLRILKGVPKSHIYKIIRDGQVRVNGSRVKPNYRLKPKDKVRIPPIRTTTRKSITKQDLSRIEMIPTIYEDQSILVVNKPPGIAVHGGTGLTGGIIELFKAKRHPDCFLELAHRLDKDTSGCLILSKTPDCLRSLHASLRRQEKAAHIRKTYHIVVVGEWQAAVHEVNAPIRKAQGGLANRVIISPSGKPARTIFRPLKSANGYTLVEVRPMTGRMHQIRVHSASAGFPIVGDRKYGVVLKNQELAHIGIKRQLLHATKIELQHPETNTLLKLESPLPDDFNELLLSKPNL